MNSGFMQAAVLAAACAARAACGGEASVTLGAFTAGSFRWKDIAGNAYSAAYRSAYSYSQAEVTVTYTTTDTLLNGTLRARNLKPFFAYQFKLSGEPENDPAANENLGFTGRWWEQYWTGAAWSGGGNLNNKGTGSFPSPNDLVYLQRRDDLDAGSPTGLHYRYTGYRPFDYFITDGQGGATVPFVVADSYHVLWKTSQRAPVLGDGPLRTLAFDPDPAAHPAYDTNYGPRTVSVYGEWERLPAGGIYLPPGDYRLGFLLTEESFHGVDGDGSGVWAHAVYGTAGFTVRRPVIRATVEPSAGGAISPAGDVEVECGGGASFGIAAADYWDLTNVLVNGESVGAAAAWTFANVTRDQSIEARFEARTATNGVPEWWLAGFGWTASFDDAALADADGDGMAAWEEYAADTDPTRAASVLAITAVGAAPGGVRIGWQGGRAARQVLDRRGSLAAGGPWTPVCTNEPPTAATHAFVDVAAGGGPAYYRVRAARP